MGMCQYNMGLGGDGTWWALLASKIMGLVEVMGF